MSHLKKNDYDAAARARDEKLRPIARQKTIDVAERGIIAWKLHRADGLARSGDLEAAKALESVLEIASDESLRARLTLDLEKLDITRQTIRLTEVYNHAVRAANGDGYDLALKLVDQILREARDPDLRRDAEELKQTVNGYRRR